MSSGKDTSKKTKIFIETSVLLAASIRLSFPDLDEIRDPFYYEASELFGYIRKNLSKRLGIITETVERESNKSLSTVITHALERKISNRKEIFDRKSAQWDRCESKMRQLRNLLLREPIDESEVLRHSLTVQAMYSELALQVRNDKEMKEEASRRKQGGGSSGMRQVMFQSHYEELRKRNYQLERLVRTPASPTDKKILAEAAHLTEYYTRREGRGFIMYLASCDTNNFSPAQSEFGLSEPVTNEIYSRFGIRCDWPKEICRLFLK